MGRVGGLLRPRDGANGDFDIVRHADLLPAGEFDLRDSRPTGKSSAPFKNSSAPRSQSLSNRRPRSATSSPVTSPSGSHAGSPAVRRDSLLTTPVQGVIRASLPAGLRREFVRAHDLQPAASMAAEDMRTGRLRARWGTIVNPSEHFPEFETPRSNHELVHHTGHNVQQTTPVHHPPVPSNRRSLVDDRQLERSPAQLCRVGHALRADHHATNATALGNLAHTTPQRTALHLEPPRCLAASAPSTPPPREGPLVSAGAPENFRGSARRVVYSDRQ